jgi:hypothetical protein
MTMAPGALRAGSDTADNSSSPDNGASITDAFFMAV